MIQGSFAVIGPPLVSKGVVSRAKTVNSNEFKFKGVEMTKISNGVASAGAATAGFGWLTTTEMAAIFGAVMAACGFIVTLVYTVRKDKRDREAHLVKVAVFKALCEERVVDDDMPI